MTFDFPDDLRYRESHEWTREQNDTVRIGITDFAQDELGDIVFIELPDEGEQIGEGESFGIVESIKAVSDLYAPVSGTVVETNESLIDQPELINNEPFDGGWMIEIEPDGDLDHLLTPEEYKQQV